MISSKERALQAFNHYSVDRVPLDLGGWFTTIHKKSIQMQKYSIILAE